MAKTREFNGNVFTDNGKGLYNAKLKKYLIYRPYPLLVDEVMEGDKIEPDNKQEYTSKQLKERFGTDNTSVINAGKEEEDRVAKIEDKKSYSNEDYKNIENLMEGLYNEAQDYKNRGDEEAYQDKMEEYQEQRRKWEKMLDEDENMKIKPEEIEAERKYEEDLRMYEAFNQMIKDEFGAEMELPDVIQPDKVWDDDENKSNTKSDYELARPNSSKLYELIDNGSIAEEDVNEMALKYNGYDEIISAMKALDYDTEKYTDIDSIYNDGSLDEMDLNRIGNELLSEMNDDDIKDLMIANEISYPEEDEEVMNKASRLYDEIPVEEYQSYISEDDVNEALDNYIRDGYFNIDFNDYLVDEGIIEEDSEEYELDRDLLADKYPDEYDYWMDDEKEEFIDSDYFEEYVPREVIEKAKQEVVEIDAISNEWITTPSMRKEEKSANAAEIASNYYGQLSRMSDSEKRSLMRELGYNYNSLNSWSGSQLYEIVRKTLLREKNRI